MHAFPFFLCMAVSLAACTRAPSYENVSMSARTGTRAAAAAKPADTSTQQASPLLPPPEALSDSVITAKVKASLLADPAMGGADVSVDTVQGVVNLTGLVASQEQAAIASAHAQRQDGVMRVDTHLATDLR